MRKIIALFTFSLAFISCKDTYIEKPKNLIAENKMVDILADIAIIEAIKVENPNSFSTRNISPDKYIYKKYKIDSLQFANSDKYYATDVDKYMKMYEKVSKKIEQKKEETEALIKKGVNVGTPRSRKTELDKQKISPINRFFRR